MLDWILVIVFSSLVLSSGLFAFLYFRNLRYFITLLESEENELWSQLGKPSLALLNITVRNSFAVVAYLLRREYQVLSNLELVAHASRARKYLIWFIISFLLIFVWVPVASGGWNF